MTPAPIDRLLVAAGRGDLDAFATFYDRTAGMVFGLSRRVLGGRAELATTRVYLELWRAAPGFDPAGPSAYAVLFSTTRRVVIGLLDDSSPARGGRG